jgi:flagellar biosynthetic protein FliS
MEAGGEFSANMRRLYSYFDHRLFQSNLQKDESGVREVHRHITQIRDAWAEMLQKNGGNATPSDSDTAHFRLPESAFA